MKPKSNHVVPNPNGGLDIKKCGSQRASAHFTTKGEVLDKGRQIIKNQGTGFFIHSCDSRIQQKDSLGNDPFPPRG
jgi:hypothetical protein